jgi:arginase
MPHSHIAIIGAPLDLGQGRRGVDMGPSALRVANLNTRLQSLGYDVEDLGNIHVEQAEATPAGDNQAKFLPQIAAACEELATRVHGAMEREFVPLVLGGDHSVAIGTVTGVSRYFRERGQRVGLIWLDAHADMNTPDTSPSGNIHGMPLACLLGMGPEPLANLAGFQPKVAAANTVIVGLREVDLTERPQVRESGVHAFTMRDIDDPKDAPGVGTAVRGGATYREAHLAMEMICDSRRMTSIEVVEVNPVLDEANRTADLAVELIMSGLGKRIL